MSRDFALNEKLTLRYSMFALSRLEAPEVIGPLPRVLRDPDLAQSITTQVAFLWAGLLHHHDMPLRDVYDLVDELGLEFCADNIKAAMSRAYPDLFPSDDDESDGDKPGKPKVS